MMKMIKICPSCQEKNDVSNLFCEKCDYDLSTVNAIPDVLDVPCETTSTSIPAPIPTPISTATPIPAPIPTQMSSMTPASASASMAIPQTHGRRCSNCGTVSPINVFRCTACGNNLMASEIVPMPNLPQSNEAAFCWILTADDDQASFLEITDGQHLKIGWDYEFGNYFRSFGKEYVSNEHGLLSVTNHELFFTDKSRNGSLINNRSIPKENAQKLSDGDILCLGGKSGIRQVRAAYFRIERKR